MLLRSVVELITPPDCLGCGAEGALLCDSCVGQVAPAELDCVRCRARLSGEAICTDCLNDFTLEGVRVAAYYDGLVKDLVAKLKFERERSVARVMGRMIAAELDAGDYDVVTAVPISPGRYRERGYAQAELIAKVVARELRLPYRRLLGRHNGAHQIGKTRAERMQQIEGAFYAVKRAKGRVLLIDDVVTTGATLEACARELKATGAVSVAGAVAAKH